MNPTQPTEIQKPVNVLLVDDDKFMLGLLKAFAQETFGDKIRISSTNDSEEARRRLDAELFDILVTDLQMPGIGGLQLLRHAKRRNAWTQVIVVTGHSGIDAVTDAMDFGATDYLVKPLNQNEFIESLREILARVDRWRRSLANTFQANAANHAAIAYACGVPTMTSAASAR